MLSNDVFGVRDGEMVDEFRDGVGGIAARDDAAGSNDPQPEWSIQDLSVSRKCQHFLLNSLPPSPPAIIASHCWTTHVVGGMQTDAVTLDQSLLLEPGDQSFDQRQCLTGRDVP